MVSGSFRTNKYIGIGKVQDEPKIKFVSKSESYLIEFDLLIGSEDSNNSDPLVHPVIVRNENLALYLKDTLSKDMRVYVEGELLSRAQRLSTSSKTKSDKAEVSYYINASEIQLIDTIQRMKYPEDIKKIR
ncbi:MAG: single-stranded DNA-binding protein [Pseudomonadales bacterium]|nr:single-stranded DNA-binding protein [Pseudomonadales bacterium]